VSRTGRVISAVGGGVLGAALVYGVLRAKKAGLFSGAAAPTKDAAGVHVRQIRRYAFAASQDTSPVVGLTHASYALILLDTLEEIVGKEAIKKAGYDPNQIRAFITGEQDRHAQALSGCDGHLQDMLAIERGEGHVEPGIVSGSFWDAVSAAPRGA
jgi:hypothetical protein